MLLGVGKAGDEASLLQETTHEAVTKYTGGARYLDLLFLVSITQLLVM